MNEIGVMQGRLSSSATKVQGFPWTSWKEEFDHARACKFNAIEWLFDADDYEQNPIWEELGREKISELISETGVYVRSLCATYFMAHPFFRVPEEKRRLSVNILNSLIPRAASLGISVILLPVLEESEIRTDVEKLQLLDSLQEPLALAEKNHVRLGLETELPAHEYRNLVAQGRHRSLGAYYDAGNATAKGYDVAADIHLLNPYLCGVHIKDRKRGGPSLPLGQGDTNFCSLFDALVEVNYTDPLILETPVGDDPIANATSNLEFIEQSLVATKLNRSSKRPGLLKHRLQH